MCARHWFFTETDMTLRALESCLSFPLIHFEVQDSTVIRRRSDVATFAAARLNTDFQRLHIHCVHRRNIVAAKAILIFMRLVPERSTGVAPAPLAQEDSIRDSHRRGEMRVEVCAQALFCCLKFMTDVAVGREGRDSRVH